MISINKLDCYQISIFIALLFYYLVKLKCIIILIVVIFLFSTKFILIYSYFLNALNNNILISLNSRHSFSPILIQQILFYLKLNAFESFLSNLILYKMLCIVYIMVLYTFIKTSFKYVKLIRAYC